MMTKKILPLVAICLLAGCGKDKEKEQTPAPFVPTELTFTKPAVGQKLTKEQIKEAKNTLSSNSKIILPPSDLIFSSKKMTTSELSVKESKLKAQDENSYALLKDIQANCNIQRPTATINATFPINGDASIENLRAGDKYEVGAKAGLNGENCPVKFDGNFGVNAYVNDVDTVNKNLKGSASMITKGQAFMIAPKYQKLLDARGIIVDTNVSGLAMKQDTAANILATLNVSGSYYSLKSDIPYSADVKYLLNGNTTGTVAKVEMIVNMTLTLPSNSIRIDIHIKASNSNAKPEVEEYYVNGNQLSKEEFNALFGQENPAIKTTKTLVNNGKF